ncbi:MAG TPA: hypothetical protein DHV29_09535 [Bacteroidales bacterium]|nr:MAG: hypothetical protein A2W94_07420 [Bacteroidetes bacterium GWE2_42_42]HBG69975.1 hypothetical protein [Bacteroidales bacterium]HCB62598.1 hypothetical protein [Bacteroidales bacterium]HCY23718.1 hypothetical protein [Bacteroidales bacterium]
MEALILQSKMGFSLRPIDNRRMNNKASDIDFYDDSGNINSRVLYYRLFDAIAFVKQSYTRADEHDKIEERLKNSEYWQNTELIFHMNMSKHAFNPDPVEENHIGQELIYKIGEGIMIHLLDSAYALLYPSAMKKEEVEKILSIIEGDTEERERKKLHKFSMITNQFGFDLEYFEIKSFDIDIQKQYNDDFTAADKKIKAFLNEPKASGIVLLHGLYGSGKTTYIRHLINSTEKNFIYVPLNMVGALNEPDFLPFITQYRDSILIIEDCENLIQSRKSNGPSNALVNLLNMGDGLLGDALRLKIICTFNADLKEIDEALLRKGRMVVRYYFDKLKIEKSVLLQTEINRQPLLNEALTLADIYNAEENDLVGDAHKKSIGFKKN